MQRLQLLVPFAMTLRLCAQDASQVPAIRGDLANAANDTARAKALAALCFNLIRSEPDSARYYGTQALALAQRIGNARATADAYNNLGWLAAEQGHLDRADSMLSKALGIFRASGRPEHRSVTLSNLGWVADKRGDRVGALSRFQEALKESALAQDTASTAILLYSIGTTYSKMKEFQRAREHMARSLDLETALGRVNKQANCLLAMGNAWRGEGNDRKAMELYAEASKRYLAIDDLLGAGLVEENSGDLFLEKDPRSALPYYERALADYSAVRSDPDKAYILQRIGEAHARLRDPAEARKRYMESMTLALATGSTELVMDLELGLAELAVAQGMSDSALVHYQRHMALKDSLQGAENQRELLRLRTVFETEKAEQENALLRSENALRKAHEAQLRIRWIAALAVAAGCIGLLLLLWRNYRMRGKHTREVEAFNAALARQRDEVQHMNDLLELKVLRSQLNPHFIYNCQSSAIAMMKEGRAAEALAYLQGFARLLRMILEHSVKDRIPIEEEAAFLRQYLELEAIRLEGLKFTVSVDPTLIDEETLLPALIVQPFVENAVWHGLAAKTGERTLNISFTADGDRLHCEVTDNGVGRGRTGSNGDHRSLGTELTNERLQLLTHRLKQRGSFVIEDLVDGTGQPKGTRVRIDLDLLPMEVRSSEA